MVAFKLVVSFFLKAHSLYWVQKTVQIKGDWYYELFFLRIIYNDYYNMSYPNWIPNWKSCSIIQTIKRFDQNTGNLFKFSVKSILIKNRKKNYWKIRIKCISSFYLFTSQSNWKNRISKKNCGQIHFLMIAVVLYVTAFWHWSLQNVITLWLNREKLVALVCQEQFVASIFMKLFTVCFYLV